MINHRLILTNYFKKFCTGSIIGLMKDEWVCGLTESQDINVSTYRPLSGSSCVKLPAA